MQTTFYRQKITKQQFDSIQSNWKNISEVDEENGLLDSPKSRMKMNLRVPIRFRGNYEYMTVNCFILSKTYYSHILLSIVSNVYKPILVSLLAASPVSLVTALLFMKPYLIILVHPFVASVIFFYYFKRIKTTSQAFVNELLKEKKT
jgi:hypothetical protein